MSTISLTLFGLSFDLTAPYSEGHVINGAEARTLNQTRKENIGNQLRKKIEALQTETKDEQTGEVSKGFTEEAKSKAAELVAAVDAEYTFALGASSAGRAPIDPVEKEARAIAKVKVTEAIQKKGLKLKDYGKEAFEAKVLEVAQLPKVVAEAQRRVKQRSNLDLEIEA